MGDIRHFLDLTDFEPDVLKAILKKAHALKAQKYNPPQLFQGLSLAMVFDKRSTRTRMSFEIAMKQLGGHTLVMSMDEMQIAGAESVKDTANVVSRYVDGVMIRMSDDAVLKEFAGHCSIPVINGMTNKTHPCQIMADILTIEEKLGSIAGRKIAWFGDVNNVSNTFVQAAPIFGFELALSVPLELKPDDLPDHVAYFEDPEAAAKDADVLVTDTWISMGQEGKAIDKFRHYQVTPTLMAKAQDTAIFMHCMPVHKDEEVAQEVLDSPANVIYDEAENRLHAQKAILAWCLEEAGVSVSQSSFNFGNA
ncbi:MAG: ornithine carbamoyltransferase [Alphaproteobacteria bacterium]|nr:ornithine carbamoyltransferase [Alphaproteobacteria bacterium]